MLWTEKVVEDPFYMFLFYIKFRYMLAFQLYKESIRKNNSNAMLAARSAFAPLFYATRHPNYQKLLLRDMVQRVQYPSELSSYFKAHESFSVSGKDNRGQGADFVHEEINKLVKSFLPIGLPTTEAWQRVCRRADDLVKIKKQTTKAAGLKDSDEVKKPKRYTREVTMMRRELRNHNHTNEPAVQKEMVSLSRAPLDQNLYQLDKLAKNNYIKYKEHLLLTGQYGGCSLTPVSVTESDRLRCASIGNKTKDEILREINVLVSALPDKNTSFAYIKDINASKKNKQALIDIYYDVKKCLDDEEELQEMCPVITESDSD